MRITTWQLWQPGPVMRSLDLTGGLTPRLESWNAKTDPAQMRLQRYLDDLQEALGALPVPEAGLFLQLDVAVEPIHWLHHHDIENYLTPVVRRLGAERFVYVRGRKRDGGPSRLAIGTARPLEGSPGDHAGWKTFACHAGSGTQTPAWKANLREKLREEEPELLPPGPVEAHLAWRCSSQRSWWSLWKPTGDAMGPVLGEPNPAKPFHPNDDRITTLHLHRDVDDTLGYLVDVGMWWRPDGGGKQERG